MQLILSLFLQMTPINASESNLQYFGFILLIDLEIFLNVIILLVDKQSGFGNFIHTMAKLGIDPMFADACKKT